MASPTLNFSSDNLITGVNVIDGTLIWTDDRNEPRQLDIETFKAADHSSGVTAIYDRSFQNRDITVIRPHPIEGITLTCESEIDKTIRPWRNIFPRYSYRWRYTNGQFSPYAPFSVPAFEPEGISIGIVSSLPRVVVPEYNDLNSYTEGRNSNMYNAATKITLSNIPFGGPDVDLVQILYTESISSTIYAIQDIEVTAAIRNRTETVLGVALPATTLEPIEITNRVLTGALPPDQLLRPFDNVPRLAKAQEITTNRLMYGNYLQRYNQPTTLNILAGFSTRDVIAVPTTGTSVKSNRSYEIGVVFIDEFGRQGSIITSAGGSITTEFSPSNRLQLTAQIVPATLPSELSWAKSYRYFVRDTSNQHFNLASSNAYFDFEGDVSTPANVTSTYIWLAFNSRDRNKIFFNNTGGEENTVLIPKRHTQSNTTGVLFEGESLHPVLDVENEVPEVLLLQAEATASASTDAEKLVARQEFQARSTGMFFVKVKIATDSGSGGGGFLSTGESQQDFATQTVSTSTDEVATFSISNLSAASNAELTYTDAGGVVRTTMIGFGVTNIVARTTPTPSGAGLIIINQAALAAFTTPTAITNQLNQTFFETVPLGRNDLELYYESPETFTINLNDDGTSGTGNDFGLVNTLDWFNCIGFADAVENDTGIWLEETRIGGESNTPGINGPGGITPGVRVTTPLENYGEDRRSTGIAWSGLYNDNTGTNRLNEFIEATGNVKEIEPNYGSIQKLHTRDTNLIVGAEDKFFRIYADKDALFNADGNTNITASNNVLGQTIPFIGEYGISLNPESFASYGSNIWCSDKARGVILQITPNNGQIFEISSRGLSDFFRDRLRTATKIIGAFDDYHDRYTLSVQGYNQNDPNISANGAIVGDTGNQTLFYDLNVEGWSSRVSFIPEGMVALNNTFYSWSNGKLYQHNIASAPRNNFYGEQYDSQIEFILNNSPSVVKEFVTLGYEGSSGWTVSSLTTNDESSDILGFVEKEGKYFSSIVTTEPIYEFSGSNIVDTGRTREKGGIKGFYATVRLENDATTDAEFFALNSKNFISSN